MVKNIEYLKQKYLSSSPGFIHNFEGLDVLEVARPLHDSRAEVNDSGYETSKGTQSYNHDPEDESSAENIIVSALVSYPGSSLQLCVDVAANDMIRKIMEEVDIVTQGKNEEVGFDQHPSYNETVVIIPKVLSAKLDSRKRKRAKHDIMSMLDNLDDRRLIKIQRLCQKLLTEI